MKKSYYNNITFYLKVNKAKNYINKSEKHITGIIEIIILEIINETNNSHYIQKSKLTYIIKTKNNLNNNINNQQKDLTNLMNCKINELIYIINWSQKVSKK